jgi:uncharacterized RDD family membrane protein YckC
MQRKRCAKSLLRVLDPSGLGRPSFGAAVIRNSPQVLASFGPVTGNSAIDAGLGIAGGVVFIAIGITISKSPTRQGFHDRLAGKTFVVRPASKNPAVRSNGQRRD